MSIKIGSDGKLYYYTTSTNDYQQWYTAEDSTGPNYIIFDESKIIDDYVSNWRSIKKKEKYLEDELFEI